MHFFRLLVTCLLIILFADLLIFAVASPSKKPLRHHNRNNTSPAAVPQKNRDSRQRQVTFGTISREEWLAKEYFGYLCASEACVTNDTKSEMMDKCFDAHTKLKSLITACFGPDRKCIPQTEEKTIFCIIQEAKRDPQLMPITLHDCVDQRITMKNWKCMRRDLMDRLKNVTAIKAGKQELQSPHTLVTSSNVTIFDM